MRNNILSEMIDAMKRKDKEKLQVLRMLKGAMQLEEIEKKRELDDEEVIAVISKQIKTRKESIAQFTGRDDLIEKTQSEIDILLNYMPQQLTEDEITKIINDVFEKVQPTGQKDIGKVMGELIPQIKGKADMGLVNQIIKSKLS